jgi:hypothetical protein
MKIMIDPGPPINVIPGEAPVYKNGVDEAEWKCKGDCDFTVVFERGSPFEGTEFGNNRRNSGLVRRDVKEGDTFKYNVTVGNETLDPIIIVKG